MANYRTENNRIVIYGLTLLGVALATLWLGYALTFTALIIYTMAKGVLSPLMNVSSHVIDLDVMEIGKGDTDFYATMVIRDFFLWIWRSLAGLVLLIVIVLIGGERQALSGGLYMSTLALLITFAGAYLFVRARRA